MTLPIDEWASYKSQEAHLTPREIQILRMAARGMTHPEIAKKLFLTTETIKSHTKKVRAKLNAKTTGQAIAIAMSREWI